jgi:hypothetical protein
MHMQEGSELNHVLSFLRIDSQHVGWYASLDVQAGRGCSAVWRLPSANKSKKCMVSSSIGFENKVMETTEPFN